MMESELREFLLENKKTGKQCKVYVKFEDLKEFSVVMYQNGVISAYYV